MLHSVKDLPFYKSDSRLFALNLRSLTIWNLKVLRQSDLAPYWDESKGQTLSHWERKLSCLSTRNNDSKYGWVSLIQNFNDGQETHIGLAQPLHLEP